MELAIRLVSGVALILFGVRFLRQGVGRLGGAAIENYTQWLANRPIRALFAGVGIGVCIPSTTSLSLLFYSCLSSRTLRAVQVMPVALGADIGVTALVMVAALPIESVSLILISGGVVGYQFFQSRWVAGTGQVMLGLGIAFLGVSFVKVGGQALSHDADMLAVIAIIQNHPLALTLGAALLSVVLQSSTATILLAMGMMGAGTAGVPFALSIVIGANLGTSITRLLISWPHPEACRFAMAMLVVKVLLALVVAASWSTVGPAVSTKSLSLPAFAAVSNLVFNVLVGCLGMCLRNVVCRGVNTLMPDRADRPEFGTRFISDNLFDSPALALGQSMREALRASDIVREMLDDVWRAIETNDEKLAEQARQRDREVDLLDREVKSFLANVSLDELQPEIAVERMLQLRFMSEIESIGDIVDKNLSELALKKIRRHLQLSNEASLEARDFVNKVRENFLIAQTVFQTRDKLLAAQLLRHKDWLDQHQRDLHDQLLLRLSSGVQEWYDAAAVHLDLLTNLRRINSCISHIGFSVCSLASIPPRGGAVYSEVDRKHGAAMPLPQKGSVLT